MMTLRSIMERTYKTSCSKGFYVKETVPELLAMIHCEVSEAMEAYRTDYREDIPNKVDADGHVATFRRWYNGPASVSKKPRGFGSEMADVILRTLSLCAYLGIDIEAEIERKLAYNEGRPFKHNKVI